MSSSILVTAIIFLFFLKLLQQLPKVSSKLCLFKVQEDSSSEATTRVVEMQIWCYYMPDVTWAALKQGYCDPGQSCWNNTYTVDGRNVTYDYQCGDYNTEDYCAGSYEEGRWSCFCHTDGCNYFVSVKVPSRCPERLR